eukprot:COSAG05_NODE_687_length_7922_cov_7.188035_12_plen_94_part_01
MLAAVLKAWLKANDGFGDVGVNRVNSGGSGFPSAIIPASCFPAFEALLESMPPPDQQRDTVEQCVSALPEPGQSIFRALVDFLQRIGTFPFLWF